MNADADNPHPAVLLFTPTGRDQALIERLLARHGIACRGCASEAELLEAVEAGDGPAVLSHEALSRDGVNRLGELVDGQPNWSELPLIILTRDRDLVESPTDPLHDRPGVRYLRRPLASGTLIGMVAMALEAHRRQLEVRDLLTSLTQVNQRLEARARELQRLTLAVSEAEDRERQRLAQLLHDDLQQLLVGAGMQVGSAAKKLARGEADAETLERVRELIREAQQKSRALSHELFPSVLHRADLTETLRWIAEHAEQALGLNVRLTLADDLGGACGAVVRFLYRSVREILCNTAKHAGVESAEMAAWRDGPHVCVEVRDDGVGFDPSAVGSGSESGGIGLAAIRERVQTLGGRMEAVSSPDGGGSRFTLSAPAYPDARPEAAPVPRPEVSGDISRTLDSSGLFEQS